MIGLTLSVNYLAWRCLWRAAPTRLRFTWQYEACLTDYILSNPDNYCVGAARRRHRIHIGQVF
ncbi:hypothetical protein [Nostoc sp.]|uniref:hypothetical protein n=1 Tax=Nostoc sp. TaxID=1180 RepID=UPI002FFBC112